MREWLFVDDGAEAMVRGIDCAPCIEPINMGVAKGTSISELAKRIGALIGYEGRIEYDTSRPDGSQGALKSAPRPRSASTSIITGPTTSPLPKDAG